MRFICLCLCLSRSLSLSLWLAFSLSLAFSLLFSRFFRRLWSCPAVSAGRMGQRGSCLARLRERYGSCYGEEAIELREWQSNLMYWAVSCILFFFPSLQTPSMSIGTDCDELLTQACSSFPSHSRPSGNGPNSSSFWVGFSAASIWQRFVSAPYAQMLLNNCFKYDYVCVWQPRSYDWQYCC